MRTYLVVALCLTLLGCGGTTAFSPTTAQPNLLVIGNSITYSPTNPNVGWYGDWGMAASSSEHDFAHITASALRVPLTAVNVATLERTPETGIARIPEIAAKVSSNTIVVVELGDNVPNEGVEAFRPAYAQLLAAVSGGKKLICTSSFWTRKVIDDLIREQCTAHGGSYILIGDIPGIPENPDRQSTKYDNPGVNIHPQDWGMARIAERIVAQAASN